MNSAGTKWAWLVSVSMTLVSALLQCAGLVHGGSTPWGTPPSLTEPGVYLVSTSPDPNAVHGPAECPVSSERVAELLETRSQLTVHGRRGTNESLTEALRGMWPAGETVLYIGLAGKSVARRVGQFYVTPLGARSPHAGGYPLKLLGNLGELHVHVATTPDPGKAELSLLEAFMAGVSGSARRDLVDPSLPLPFANLQLGERGPRKTHGIEKARQGRAARTTLEHPPASATRADARRTQTEFPLNVTARDIAVGQIRVTVAPKRALLLPRFISRFSVTLQGVNVTTSWNPRLGPDKERSGLLRPPREVFRSLLTEPTTLFISRGADGSLNLTQE